ncbi:MAG: hypothetical protein H0S85_13635 [Desulfovibrionaceae bacterium]|jgi:NCS2 family nucleobase:cation symporter-2/xanthine permease XanP|nr:hypothetical protein [Desulfovibrionaceae bacterium]
MQRDALNIAVDERPSAPLAAALGLTHVLLIFDGIIFVPNVLGKTAALSSDALQFATFATLAVAALFTFLQSRRRFGLGAGFILFTGSYSAFLVCTQDAVRLGGLELLATMTLLTAPLVFLYTFFIRFFRHIITPAVGGVVILLIAVAMVPISLDLWAGEPTARAAPMATLGVGGLTILVLTGLMLFGNAALRIWSPLLALACGCAAALAAGQLHMTRAAALPWFGLPPLAWPGIETHLSVGHVPLLLAFAMAMLVSVIENTGNIMLVQQISLRNFRRVSYDRIQGGLYCDGLSKVVAGLLGTAVPSIYCDNLPVIEITGVASRRVGVWGALILLLLALMPKVSGFVLDLPGAVLGSFLLVISAMLFHAGIGLVTINPLSNQHGIILGLSLTVGLVAESGTFFPGVVPAALAPMLQNSVAVGGFTAFFLSTLAHLMPKRGMQGSLAARVEEVVRLRRMLERGRERLRLDEESLKRLNLCCEEVFVFMVGAGRIGPDKAVGPGAGAEAVETGGVARGDERAATANKGDGDGERRISFRVARVEGGWFTEIICGHEMDDINNFAAPNSFYHAAPEELDRLGLVLFSRIARDVRHLEISGYSYISFLI